MILRELIIYINNKRNNYYLLVVTIEKFINEFLVYI